MRNPLDPNAWLTEPHPFDVAGETADIRLGVHAADNFDTALAYAVHKASQEGNLPEPNCGIIFELDMSGLEPLPEGDAVQESKYEDVVIGEMMRTPEITKAYENLDGDGLAAAVRRFAEFTEEGEETTELGYFEEWFSRFWEEYVRQIGPWRIVSVLSEYARDDPEGLFQIIDITFMQNSFPLDVWAEAIGQYRYMASVGFDRLLKVWAVRPVAPMLVDEDWVEDDEGSPVVFSMYEVEAPGTILLWDSGRKVRDPMYHGTDVSRARSAFPEIADMLVNPWSYGQPKGVGPA